MSSGEMSDSLILRLTESRATKRVIVTRDSDLRMVLLACLSIFLVASSGFARGDRNAWWPPRRRSRRRREKRDKEPSFDVKGKKRACCNSRHWLYRAFEFIYFSFTRGCRPRIFTLSNPTLFLLTLDNFFSLSLLFSPLHRRTLAFTGSRPISCTAHLFQCPIPAESLLYPLYRAPLFRT